MVKKLVFLFLFLVSLCGCSNKQDATQESFIQSRLDKFESEAAEFRALGGYNISNGINLLNGYTDTLYGNVSTKDPTDEFYLLFNTNDSNSFIFKVFVDYTEVTFIIADQEYKAYPFNTTNEKSVSIPFRFCENYWNESENSSHIVTVAVFNNPDQHISNDTLNENYVCADYEIYLENGKRKIDRLSEPIDAEKYISAPFSGFMLNQDFEFEDKQAILYPDTQIDARPGEDIELAFYIGDNNNTEAVIIVLINWLQADINGENYKHIKTVEGKVSCGKICIQAPESPGEYDVVSFICRQPFEQRGESNFRTNDVATRFTLNIN